MAVEAQRLPVEALADAAGQVAATGDLRTALAAIADAAAEAVSATKPTPTGTDRLPDSR